MKRHEPFCLHGAVHSPIFCGGILYMQLALISDIHSNLPALETVIERIDEENIDAIICLGDVVGYGPDPAACLEIIRNRCSGVVLGNHDLAVAEKRFQANLPRDGRKAAQHNRNALNKEDLDYLRSLPFVIEEYEATFVHATPQNPELWLRMTSYQMSQVQFEHFQTSVCFQGHTHRPAIISDKLGVLQVRPGHRYLVNIGSVGQPRDGDPRACVAFFDTDTCSYRLERAEYDIEAAVDRFNEENLPKRLGTRLTQGV